MTKVQNIVQKKYKCKFKWRKCHKIVKKRHKLVKKRQKNVNLGDEKSQHIAKNA